MNIVSGSRFWKTRRITKNSRRGSAKCLRAGPTCTAYCCEGMDYTHGARTFPRQGGTWKFWNFCSKLLRGGALLAMRTRDCRKLTISLCRRSLRKVNPLQGDSGCWAVDAETQLRFEIRIISRVFPCSLEPHSLFDCAVPERQARLRERNCGEAGS